MAPKNYRAKKKQNVKISELPHQGVGFLAQRQEVAEAGMLFLERTSWCLLVFSLETDKE